MDLTSRIRRRQRSDGPSQLVVDYEAISPVAHLDEPVDRGPVMEKLLDFLDPVFDGDLPPNAYVWGQPGVGKSAVVTALFAHLTLLLSQPRAVIHTSTRAQSLQRPAFVYVDAREANSDFGLYHAMLDQLVDETVPEQGVGTETLATRLREKLRPPDESAIVAVDHVGESGTYPVADVAEALAPFENWVSWLAVGRAPPESLDPEVRPSTTLEIPRYERHDLVDILTNRSSTALARRAIEHEQMRRIARWADGNAHDALAAVFGAAELASADDETHVREQDIDAAMNAVPRPSESLGRVLALPANRQRVLRTLVDLDEDERSSVDAATTAIAAVPAVDLSEATVKRFLYELAESGIVERVTTDRTAEVGRPPSRLEPRFPTLVFEWLYDVQAERR